MPATTKQVQPKAKPVSDGYAALPLVDQVTLNLDNGEQFTFDIAKELDIPDDFDDVSTAAHRAPGMLAFWDGQMERALYAVRMAEAQLAALEGRANAQVRLKIEADREGELVAEPAIKAGVDARKDVIERREALAALRYHYGLLRSVRDAASHRVFILNRLLDQAAKSHSAQTGHAGE